MCFATAATLVSVGASVISGVSQISAAQQQADAQRQQAAYNAQVAENNRIIAEQNAEYATRAGLAKAAQESLKGRIQLGKIKAAQAASGIVTDSGSALDVQEGAREANVLDTATVLHNDQLEAYGYRSQAQNFEAQKRLKILEGEQADAGPGTMAGLGTILSGVGSAGAKWAAANPSSPKAPTGSYSGGTGTNPLTGLRYGGV